MGDTLCTLPGSHLQAPWCLSAVLPQCSLQGTQPKHRCSRKCVPWATFKVGQEPVDKCPATCPLEENSGVSPALFFRTEPQLSKSGPAQWLILNLISVLPYPTPSSLLLPGLTNQSNNLIQILVLDSAFREPKLRQDTAQTFPALRSLVM